MNRRNFFNKLAGAVLGCYLAVGIKKNINISSEINSEWFDAPYEVSFMVNKQDYNLIPIIFKRPRELNKDEYKTYIRIDSKGNIFTPTEL